MVRTKRNTQEDDATNRASSLSRVTRVPNISARAESFGALRHPHSLALLIQHSIFNRQIENMLDTAVFGVSVSLPYTSTIDRMNSKRRIVLGC